jgi:hypothetical protein
MQSQSMPKNGNDGGQRSGESAKPGKSPAVLRGEVQYRRVRSAHFRRLPSGNVVFAWQTSVRPDLPARE